MANVPAGCWLSSRAITAPAPGRRRREVKLPRCTLHLDSGTYYTKLASMSRAVPVAVFGENGVRTSPGVPRSGDCSPGGSTFARVARLVTFGRLRDRAL